jgi:hypothetical protein
LCLYRHIVVYRRSQKGWHLRFRHLCLSKPVCKKEEWKILNLDI